MQYKRLSSTYFLLPNDDMAFHMTLVLAACLFFSTCSASIFQDGSLGGDCAKNACQLSLSGNFWDSIASNIPTSLSSLTATRDTSMVAITGSTIHGSLENATPTLTLGSANVTHRVAASSAVGIVTASNRF